MANGRTHAITTLILAGASAIYCQHNDLTQWHTVGIVSGVLIGPDLDVDGGNISNKILRSVPVVGGAMDGFWLWYWRLYAEFMQHRGLLSHSFVVSTLFRYACAFWPMLLIPGAVMYWEFLYGLMLSDALHIVLDMITEFKASAKRLIRKARKRFKR